MLLFQSLQSLDGKVGAVLENQESIMMKLIGQDEELSKLNENQKEMLANQMISLQNQKMLYQVKI